MSTSNLYPRFSDAEFSRRYTDARAAMQAADLSVLVIYGTVSAHSEVLYLSNFPVSRERPYLSPRR